MKIPTRRFPIKYKVVANGHRRSPTTRPMLWDVLDRCLAVSSRAVDALRRCLLAAAVFSPLSIPSNPDDRPLCSLSRSGPHQHQRLCHARAFSAARAPHDSLSPSPSPSCHHHLPSSSRPLLSSSPSSLSSPFPPLPPLTPLLCASAGLSSILPPAASSPACSTPLRPTLALDGSAKRLLEHSSCEWARSATIHILPSPSPSFSPSPSLLVCRI